MAIYKRLHKKVARQLFDRGEEIWLLPAKVNPRVFEVEHPMVIPISIKKVPDYGYADQFNRRVAEYEWYNCCSQLGYYAHYFIKED